MSTVGGRFPRSLVIVVATSALPGCAQLQQMTADDMLACAGATGFGAGVGYVVSGGDEKGAIIGGTLAALGCIAYTVETIKTRSAAEVEQGYQIASSSTGLPLATTVVDYKTAFTPGPVVRPGGSTAVRSQITLIRGQNDPSPKVEEELQLLDPQGKPRSKARKALQTDGSGEYTNTFTFRMPAGIPDGMYPVRTALFVNDQEMDRSSLSMQVAVRDGAVVQVAKW